MKKLLALVLAASMMFGAAAMAEGTSGRTVLQDKLPPAIVTEKNVAGETILACVYDAEGNLMHEIKDDGSLQLTDVSRREIVGRHEEEEVDEVVVTRLTGAYEGVMDGVHHSDVECKLHQHEVKVDINMVLESLKHVLNAHDLVMYELYDVMVDSEVNAMLVDKAYMEMTFQLLDHQPDPLIIIFTPDGIEWQVIGHAEAGKGKFTVRLEEPGTLALLCDGTEAMGIGKTRQKAYVPGTTEVTVTPGGNFTPSVSGKPAPEVVTNTTTDGKTLVGYVRSDDGLTEIPVPDDTYVIVTPVAEKEYVLDIQTYEHLKWAFESILEAEDVGDLYHEHDRSVSLLPEEHTTIAPDIDAILQQMGLGMTHDQLVVKDLFEVTAYGDYVHYLYDPEYYLEMTFDADIAPETPVVVLHSPDSVHWHTHPVSEYTRNAAGHITLKMYDPGAVAFLVPAQEQVNAETAVQSPN